MVSLECFGKSNIIYHRQFYLKIKTVRRDIKIGQEKQNNKKDPVWSGVNIAGKLEVTSDNKVTSGYRRR